MQEYIDHNAKADNKRGDAGGFIAKSSYKCVKCGEYISPAVVNFFNNKGLKSDSYLCYKCQFNKLLQPNN